MYRLWRLLSWQDILEEPFEDLVVDFKVTATHNLIDRAQKTGCSKIILELDSLNRLVQGFKKDLVSQTHVYSIFAESVERFFQSFSASNGLIAVGDKVPEYINIPDILANALKNSKIIYIKRDPRATIHSVMKFQAERLHLFAMPSAFAMATSYFLTHIAMKRFSINLSRNCFLSLTQEDLKKDPGRIAEKLSVFLSVPLDDNIQRYIENMSRNQAIKDWRQEMNYEDVKAVEAVAKTSEINLTGVSVSKSGNNAWTERAMPLLT